MAAANDPTPRPLAGRAERLADLAASSAVFTGMMALVVAVLGVLRGEWVAAGVCLVAAAVAFGGILNALFRN